MSKVLAGVQLVGMGAVWLLAWVPMLVFALTVALVEALRRQGGRVAR